MRVHPILAALVLCGPAFADEEIKGDPVLGRALYSGAQAFEKGGPPCAACHAVGAVSPAMAASFGPDLSQSQAALDLDVLDGVMSDQPYRTMKPLYAGKPISAAERAHVATFIRSVAGGERAHGGLRFALQAVLLALGIGAVIAWGRRRVPSVREELRRNAR